jgi:methionyl-tRNA formyltransferase
MKKQRIIFMGTPEFAAVALRALCDAGHDPVAVYTQPPRPKGRGQITQNSPVHEYALLKNIPVFHPVSLKKQDEQDKFAALKADMAVVAAYGLILPKAVLSAPLMGCMNIHASLLPRWRGASPIQRAIWSGDSETGVTLMHMDEGLDTGPMITKRSVAITPKTTASSLHDELASLGGSMIVDLISTLARGETMPSEKQDNAQSTYAPLLHKNDGRVNWNQSALEIDRQLRALHPWPGVWTMHQEKRIKILSCEFSGTVPSSISGSAPGTLLDREGSVVCGDGVIMLRSIQPENAKPMTIASAINGGLLKLGGVFT